MKIFSTKPNIDFASRLMVRSDQTASVLATSGWSNSGNGFSVTIPVTGLYKLIVEFNAYAAASSDGYWCIGIDGANNLKTIRRVVTGAGGSVSCPTHIEVEQVCTAGQVITLRNDEASGDVRADPGSGGNALGYIKAELLSAYVNVYDSDKIYSTTEINTGRKWIDGKSIYRKVINFGALPDTTTKNVAHGIVTLDTVIPGFPMATMDNGTIQMPLPRSINNAVDLIDVYCGQTNVSIATWSATYVAWNAYAIMEYTKV